MSVLPGVTLIIPAQAVCDLVVFSFDIGYVEVKSGHIVHPSHLTACQMCLHLEELEGLMICNDMDPVSHQFVFPLHQHLEYPQRFEFMYSIVVLRRGELF